MHTDHKNPRCNHHHHNNNDTKHTAEGLQQIIDTIQSEGYEIVPLDELIYFENYEINHEGRQIKKRVVN